MSRLHRRSWLSLALLWPLFWLRAQTPVPAPAPVPLPADAPRLGSTVFHWDQFVAKPSPAGQYRAGCDAPTATFERLEFHITTLLPGRTAHPPHFHPQEELILIKEGQVEARINGQPLRAGPGSLLFYASRNPHNLTNVGDTPATYFVFTYFTAATRAAPATPATDSVPAGKLRSGVFDWEKLAVTPTETGVRRAIVDSPTVTLANFEAHASTLNSGEAVPEHYRAKEELLIVKEGQLEVMINRVTQRVGVGSVVFFASNDVRSIRNPGEMPATYFIFSAVSDVTPKETH
jgi:quercetin dioxygenase-like cupin family protein